MKEAITAELLAAIDSFRCVSRHLYSTRQLSTSDMLVFGAVLRAIEHGQPPPKMSDIAAHAGISTAAISQIAGQLEKRGLVERYSLPEDRRTVYVRITEAGEYVFNEETAKALRIMGQVTDAMGKQKCEQFIALSREIKDKIKAL